MVDAYVGDACDGSYRSACSSLTRTQLLPAGTCTTDCGGRPGRLELMSYYSHIRFWNTSLVTDLSGIFYGLNAFNADVRLWDTSSATTMSRAFASAHTFNQPLSGWSTARVTDMFEMFKSARVFNQPLAHFDTSLVADSGFVSMFDH